MGIDALARGAAEELGAEIEFKDDMYFLTVPANDEDGDEDEYREIVSVFGGEEMGGIYVRNTFGYVTDDTDFRALLEVPSDECYARVYLEEDDGGDYAVIEAGVPLEGLTPAVFAIVIQEVVDNSAAVRDIVPDDDDDSDDEDDDEDEDEDEDEESDDEESEG
jgi:hypothetical protein